MKYICALVVVEDVHRSRFLYETILGQRVIEDYGEDIVFEGRFALHKKDHFQKLLDGRQISSGTNNFELYFEEDELEILEKELERYQLEFIHKIDEQPWGQRAIRFYDYDRNIVEIGESMEHVAYRKILEKKPVEEVMRITGLPIEKIENAVKRYKQKPSA